MLLDKHSQWRGEKYCNNAPTIAVVGKRLRPRAKYKILTQLRANDQFLKTTITISQSASIYHKISSAALFSTSQTSKMHCSTTTDRRIISQPHYMVVGRYQKQNPLLNHQSRIETTVSTHTRKRQHKRLRIASASSNIFETVVANKA